MTYKNTFSQISEFHKIVKKKKEKIKRKEICLTLGQNDEYKYQIKIPLTIQDMF